MLIIFLKGLGAFSSTKASLAVLEDPKTGGYAGVGMSVDANELEAERGIEQARPVPLYFFDDATLCMGTVTGAAAIRKFARSIMNRQRECSEESVRNYDLR